jgi:hypothetical protein
LIADKLEEYSLSSGSSWYCFSITAAPGDCHWLVGRVLEVAEVATKRKRRAVETKAVQTKKRSATQDAAASTVLPETDRSKKGL